MLSLREVLEETKTAEELLEQALEKLDMERKQKAERLKQGQKRAESIGAGLLIQYALKQAVYENAGKGSSAVRVQHVEFAQVLAELDVPSSIEYEYGANGKPFFKNFPYFFNLSHSGEYVVCGISEREIGVDIQQERVCDGKKLSERFFSQTEKELLERCVSDVERSSLFYELWTGKEAYGKLTGEGIIASAGADINDLQKKGRLCLVQIPAPEGYKITMCHFSEDNTYVPGFDTPSLSAVHR